VRYGPGEGSSGVKHHHHVCTVCGDILEYDDFLKEDLRRVKRTTAEGLPNKYGFKITGHVFQFYGLC
jgi:Fur family ferric uptake transcriptional regulator